MGRLTKEQLDSDVTIKDLIIKGNLLPNLEMFDTLRLSRLAMSLCEHISCLTTGRFMGEEEL
ncbi:hypothetical protein [Bacillus sp. THAF10]|uniref:hypothetical protein n=1 Tax=Bacillus sp. THAF10 TaxID=2587848 RepID=UPI0012688424|nr:hypothetical protein [Bacillus sp. THAF10]